MGQEELDVNPDFKQFFEESRESYLRGWADASKNIKEQLDAGKTVEEIFK